MKRFIPNREEQRICVVVEKQPNPAPLVFIAHGLGGSKDELAIRALAEAFFEAQCTVVTFDARNTFGESEGKYEDGSITSYFDDVEDVIAWASGEQWYSEPFILAGHSFGGIATGLFAQKYPRKVQALAPISTIISGELTLQTEKSESNPRIKYLEEWKRDGVLVRNQADGGQTRLKWACMEDWLKQSLLSQVDELAMPVLLVVGENDLISPAEHQKILLHELPNPKELHVIKGAKHSFEEAHERQELKQIVKSWVADHGLGQR